MNREEAIKILKEHHDHWMRLLKEGICTEEEGENAIEALDMAIKALDQEPCGDAIDRSKAIMIASGYCHPANVAKELAKLPSVNPQPCEDAISRQAVQDYIAKYLSQYLYNDVREAVEVIDEYIGELPSVNPTKTGWIPVSERLPDDYGRYLISTEDGRVETINYGYTNDMPDEIAFYEWDDEEWQCWKPNVTAWMPRPKPYEPQERSDKA